ncbi:NAD(P)H-dependent flavin oxidoreductase YrpB, nitropropane dioxygenase family [Agrococcus jejuensis]|uniref:Propionate 3-nitronate monooxygenase n=2 Tax=Agrococcus jejuensis TaxID=399736 RepID=A0A1G8H2T6_9MICO|nr:NAD(P)H-dependent flavin oxidoreductase YrpB, nitropropane dioxygenase family [Agrococcus jejuensis]
MLPLALQHARVVAVAPMAGGATTPALVAAVEAHGAFAQLAAGYLTAEALRARIAETRALGASRFGVNLFVPNLHRIAPSDYEAYGRAIAADVARVVPDAAVPPLVEDDDDWEAKVDVVVEARVPVVSLTFGLPDDAVLARLRAAGILTLQTVTSEDEALAAANAGVDALTVQASAAGGHSGIWTRDALPADVPLPTLVAGVRAATPLPIVAAGGVASRDDVRRVIDAGADAVAIGTLALRATEAGTSATHRAALADASFDRTELTRAFTGRPARALVTPFVEAHRDAPSGYPALHHLTRPMRAAAAASGDASLVHLWAGEAWRAGRDAPIADILDDLEP